ncbi:MAG: alpha/beta fold hydrolase [Pseudorhizobium sp.]
MFSKTSRFESPTGASLAYRHREADAPAIGILLICHGLAEHSGRYGAFADKMAGAGFHVYAHDHRGHGHTTAPGAVPGRFAKRDGMRKVIGDVCAMRDMAAAAHPGLPVILFGHSMGGLIALNTAVDRPEDFQALTVWNSNFHPGPAGRVAQAVLLAERALKGSDVPSTILPMATFRTWARSMPEKRTEADWLSNDPAEVDAYLADPLCGFDASVSLWLDLFALTYRGPTLVDRLRKDMPVYLVGGEKDPATSGGREITWLSRHLKTHGLRRVTSRIWPKTRHETLNDTVRDEATAEFSTWARQAVELQTE